MPSSPIHGVLDEPQRETAATALQATLTDLIGLSLSAKQAHWNVVGPLFRPVHQQLDELADTARECVDEVAERLAAIGCSPNGTAKQVAEYAATADFPTGWQSDKDTISTVVAMLKTLIQRLRTHIEETDKADLVTQDLLIEVASQLEKAYWMWQAQQV